MSNIQSVKAQIQSLINKANETTGNTDTNLTDGVNALVEGFGQGGSDSDDGDFVTVVFYDVNGNILKKEMVNRNTKVYAPINANGTSS